MELIQSPYPMYKVWDIVQDYPAIADAPNDPCWQNFLEDIRHNGLQTPIVRWQGAVVDGFHRLKACGIIGITPDFHDLPDDLSEEEMRNKVASLNLHRRHLNEGQRAVIAAKELKRRTPNIGAHIVRQQIAARARQEQVADLVEQGLTNQEMAEELGVTVRQIQQDKKEVREGALEEPMPSVDDVPTMTWEQASEKHQVSRDTIAKARQVIEADPDLADAVLNKGVPLNDAVRSLKMEPEAREAALEELQESERKVNFAAKAKEAQREILRERGREFFYNTNEDDRFLIVHREVSDLIPFPIEPGTLDAIICDPPYPKEFAYVWKDLADFAAKALKPEGILCALSGSGTLDTAMEGLLTRKDALWFRQHIAYKQVGPPSLIHSHRIKSTTRCLLVFHRYPEGYPKNDNSWYPFEEYSHLTDLIEFSGEASKENLVKDFAWAQSINGFREIIKELTTSARNPANEPANWHICDPFVGTGTTGVAALEANHFFVGADIDDTRAGQALQNIKAFLGQE